MFHLIKQLFTKKIDDNDSKYVNAPDKTESNTDALLKKAGECIQFGRYLEAEDLYQSVIISEPTCAKAHRLLGFLNKEKSDLVVAERMLKRAIELNPDDSDAHYMLGNLKLQNLVYSEAEVHLSLANKLDPENVFAIKDLIICLCSQEKYKDALNFVETSMQALPEYPEWDLYIGNIKAGMLEFSDAENSYKAALNNHPDSIELLKNIAEVQYNQNKLNEAIQTHKKILGKHPDDHEIRLYMGFCQLALGNFTEGFKNYEFRYKVEGGDKLIPSFPKPLLEPGLAIDGKVILVVAEQGFGDLIQFSRYREMIKSKGGKVIFYVHKPILQLFKESFGESEVITELNDPIHFDYYCSVMSLPYLFQTQLATIPQNIPYLNSNVQLTEEWRNVLKVTSERPLVGISWSGNKKFDRDKFRSISLEKFLAVIDPSISYVVLQTNCSDEELKQLCQFSNIITHDKPISSFADTAAIMQLCDSVISVDTAIIHLAGALGRPAHLLLPFVPDWRWMLETTSSPWYSSVRIHRQAKLNEWNDVIKSVKLALQLSK